MFQHQSNSVVIGRKGAQPYKINDPTVSAQHCILTPNGDGTYRLEDLTEGRTSVNGRGVIRTTVKPGTMIKMGNFTITVRQLLNLKTPPAPKPTFNIAHLYYIWNEFNDTNLEIAKKQRTLNLIRSGAFVFTLSSGIFCTIVGKESPYMMLCLILTFIGFIGILVSWIMMKNLETPMEKQARQDMFDSQWICPNPECSRTIPARNYHLLVRNHKSCPYCKCNFEEDFESFHEELNCGGISINY